MSRIRKNLRNARDLMAAICGRRRDCFVAIFLAFVAPVAAAGITSENHSRLREALEKHPKADANGDGILTFAEYQELRKSLGPGKRSDGREAGPISTLLANGDLLITDFEENNQGRMRQWGWTIEGDSFKRGFAYATGIMKRRAEDHSGKYLLSSYAETEAATGRIVSPEFKIELNFIQFQLSGGKHPHRTCVNLVVDNRVLRTVTGRNSDRFETVAFNVTALKGRHAKLEIVDAHTGIWGHINVDRMIQTDDRQTARRVVAIIPVDFGRTFGTVLTFDLRRRGPLSIDKNRLGIGGETVEIGRLLLAICENEAGPQKTQGALRFINGEVWNGQPLRLEKDQIVIQSPLFKQREVPLDQIASIEFKPGKTIGGEPGTLYRDQGEPIPGKLVWIRDKDIAIDCALGIVPVPRQTVQRLILAKPRQQLDRSLDEVGLVDGSLLSGTLKVDGNQLVLDHGVLGALPLEWSAISYVRRAAKGVIWLDQLEAKVMERVGPALPPPPPTVMKSEEPNSLRVVRMMPGTLTRYRLPTGTSNRVFRAILAPVPGSKADVKVRVLDGNSVLWERQVNAESDPIEVAVNIKQAKEFAIEVKYSGPLAFPCGVDWRDAFVLSLTDDA